MIRGRPDARWLPSRFHFALFRLFAFLRMRNAKPEQGHVILMLDRYQNPFEMVATGVWMLLTLTCFMAAALFAAWPLPLALAVAALVAAVLLHIAFGISGLVVAPLVRRVTGASALHINSTLMMLLFIALTAYFATRPTWVRFAAWQALALIALDAAAAIVVFMLRDSMARLEAAVGGSASGH